MPLSRFFGRKVDPAPADLAPEQPDDYATDDDGSVEDGAEPETAVGPDWRARAEAVLPTGVSTGSKRASALYGEGGTGPTHFVAARGAYVTTVDGAQLLDCTMALGSVALGYAEPRVTRAVVEAASEGSVCGLSSWREVELAERLCAVVPCGERAQLLKTGAEATAAAVRLARAYTGRTHVVCSGYFGWLDWWTDAEGVPAGVRTDVTRVPFGDTPALEVAVAAAGANLAAVVLEPVVAHAPPAGWLERARALCDATGAALVFDEVKTGFRVAPGGWQESSGIVPDLAAFGKAMANGFPLAAVVGRAPLMDAARSSWISSTLASESTALAAALAVLDWHEEADICATLAQTGREMREAVDSAIEASGIEGVATEGIDQMWRLRWDDAGAESQFVQLAVERGVLFKRGAYNFAAIAHDEAAILRIEAAASGAFVALRGAR